MEPSWFDHWECEGREGLARSSNPKLWRRESPWVPWARSIKNSLGLYRCWCHKPNNTFALLRSKLQSLTWLSPHPTAWEFHSKGRSLTWSLHELWDPLNSLQELNQTECYKHITLSSYDQTKSFSSFIHLIHHSWPNKKKVLEHRTQACNIGMPRPPHKIRPSAYAAANLKRNRHCLAPVVYE